MHVINTSTNLNKSTWEHVPKSAIEFNMFSWQPIPFAKSKEKNQHPLPTLPNLFVLFSKTFIDGLFNCTKQIFCKIRAKLSLQREKVENVDIYFQCRRKLIKTVFRKLHQCLHCFRQNRHWGRGLANLTLKDMPVCTVNISWTDRGCWWASCFLPGGFGPLVCWASYI